MRGERKQRTSGKEKKEDEEEEEESPQSGSSRQLLQQSWRIGRRPSLQAETGWASTHHREPSQAKDSAVFPWS